MLSQYEEDHIQNGMITVTLSGDMSKSATVIATNKRPNLLWPACGPGLAGEFRQSAATCLDDVTLISLPHYSYIYILVSF